jgi:hypothetical protein
LAAACLVLLRREVTALSEQELASVVREDKIDILVELTGGWVRKGGAGRQHRAPQALLPVSNHLLSLGMSLPVAGNDDDDDDDDDTDSHDPLP